MADKQSFSQEGSETAQSLVTTTGTTTAGTIKVQWDEADTLQLVMDNLEKAKLQIVTYYLKRG